MNIAELDSYNLSDAIKFNEKLNPRIWSGSQMLPQVREKLLAIADNFKQSLGLSDLEVKDITVSGSNAGYTYTPHSDIDLHLVVDLPNADMSEVYRELFDAKKYEYNEEHNIKIGGYDVETYVENANESPVSQGVFSVLNNNWITIPRKRRSTVNDNAVRSKYEDIKHRIESVVASEDSNKIKQLIFKIKRMRNAGLAEHGELGSENLAYKMLRTQGFITKLYEALAAAQDSELSLTERKKKKKRVKYGFGAYWAPGFGFNNSSGSSSGDFSGGDGGTEDLDTDGIMMTRPSNMSSESVEQPSSETDTVKDFVGFCVDSLGIQQEPQLKLMQDPEWSAENKTFGRYDANTNQLEVSMIDRHIMDILRTVAHELTHQRQKELGEVPDHAGATGSRWENEANAKAGVLMRNYAEKNPELFVAELSESLAQEFNLFEQQDLFEISMSPANLRVTASKINALAGMEFEMIVAGAGGDADAGREYDFDQDRRPNSIKDIIDFFADGDQNTVRDLHNLKEALGEAWMLYADQQAFSDWESDASDYMATWVARNVGDDEIIRELELHSDSDDDITLTKAHYRDFAEMCIRDDNDYLEEARDEYTDDARNSMDESDWLEHDSITRMSDVSNSVSNTYNIEWPHFKFPGGLSIEDIGKDFGNTIGRPVDTSEGHGKIARRPGYYVVETDSSLEPDSDDDQGLEFVSPPLPIQELLSDLDKVQEWAGRTGCYTNESTGLHINVSVPNFNIEKLDYVKLAVLLGDQYVLDQFGRAGNTYTNSALGIVKQRIAARPEDAAALLDKMKQHMNAAASKLIHSGRTEKYTSINTQDGYVEFRSPGGDWLGELATGERKIDNTLLRMVVALDAACDETKYKEEYAKKLYKLLAPGDDKTNTMGYFAKFVAGELPTAELKSFIRQAQLERKAPKKAPSPAPVDWRDQLRRTIDASTQNIVNPLWDPTDEPPVPSSATPGAFTGAWKILDATGQELYRFSGIGNGQADANRVAADWIRNNNYSRGEVSVLPIVS